MRQFNSITIKQYNHKKIAFGGDNSKRFSVLKDALRAVVGKAPYPEGIDLPIHLKEGSYTFPHHKKGVTLLELLIALSIFSLIVVGFANIDTFSRYHVVSSDRRAKLQNDASYVLEHMAKNITGTDISGLGGAIGDETNPPSSRPVDTSEIDGNPAVQVWIDFNQNGRRDSEPTDRRIAYRYRDSGGERYQMQFCPECTNSLCTICEPPWGSDVNNILSRKITNFTPFYSSSNNYNYIEMKLTACWDPDESPVECGKLDNPELVMKNRISMPAVSTH